MRTSIFSIPQSHDELLRAYVVLKELRPHLSLEEIQNLHKNAEKENNYKLVCLQVQDEFVAVMGYRILVDFVHGRHFYIDDLVSTEKFRSQGYGALLLKHAEEMARELGCTNLRLCTGIDNDRGKSFYEKQDWELRAVVYKKKLK